MADQKQWEQTQLAVKWSSNYSLFFFCLQAVSVCLFKFLFLTLLSVLHPDLDQEIRKEINLIMK